MDPASFPFRSAPFAHQLREFEIARSLTTRAKWWEMGTGKTKPTIDEAAWLHMQGAIRGVLVLAPSGVHTNWVTDELPAHLPEPVAERSLVLGWSSSRAGQVGFRQRVAELLAQPPDRLPILCMSYDGIMTEAGRAAAKRLLTSRPCLQVLDESHRIKNPSTNRTKRVLACSPHAPYRRILTGTPVDNSPFDAYAQLRFLDPDVWRPLGISNFAAFKAHFGVFGEGWNGRQNRAFRQLLEYRNLDLLHSIMDRYGSRLRKEDVLDLPPKVYQKVYFDLAPDQARVYRELRDEMLAWLADGSQVTAELAITRMLRLQQVTSGWAPADEDGVLRPLARPNPRVRCLLDVLEDVPGQAIVWAQRNADIDDVAEAIRDSGSTAVVFDGRTSDEDRDRARSDFQAGRVRFFVSKPSVGGAGLTLTAASTVVYYNNGFSLTDRRQSEDRAHRIGQKNSVCYVDLVASGTIDSYVMRVLRDKRSLSDRVLGDPLSEWI